MKWYFKLLIALGIAVAIYIFGCIYPLKFLIPELEKTALKTPEYLNLFISSFAAVITFLAVIVALFKEDIRSKWSRVKFSFDLTPYPLIEKLKEEETSSSETTGTNIPVAAKYLGQIQILNTGNLPARNCELYLQDLTYSNSNSTTTKRIESTGKSLPWNTDKDYKILMPPEGHKIVNIIELLSPETQSSPKGEEEMLPPKLTIGNMSCAVPDDGGIWDITFILYSENSKPHRLQLKIKWNGQWEHRLTEMKTAFKIEKV